LGQIRQEERTRSDLFGEKFIRYHIPNLTACPVAIEHSDAGEENGMFGEPGVGIRWLVVAFWLVIYSYGFNSRGEALL
jgi:hypothetical protein